MTLLRHVCNVFNATTGVINVLSNNNIKNLDSYLCKFNYMRYAGNVYNYSHNCPGCPTQI